MKRFFVLVVKFARQLWAWIVFGLSAAFGRLSWSPPAWVKYAGAQCARALGKAKAKPKAAAMSGLGILCLFAGAYFTYDWYSKRPKPQTTGFTLTTPGLAPIKEDAKPLPLKVHFSRPVAPLELVGKNVPAGISIDPPFAGQWKFEDDKNLVFKPDLHWPIAQKFHVRLQKPALAKSVKLTANHFDFETEAFTVRLTKSEFFQDPTNPQMKKVITSLEFSHPVDVTSLEKNTSLSLEGKAQQFNVIYEKLRGKAHIHSQSIAIPSEDSKMSILISSGVKAVLGGPGNQDDIEEEVLIPGIDNFFKIKDAYFKIVRKKDQEPERVLVVRTTAGARSIDLKDKIKTYKLPKFHPKDAKKKDKRPYRWTSINFVKGNVLEHAEPMQIDLVESELEYSSLHTFTFEASSGDYVYVDVDRGLQSFGGYVLSKPYTRTLQVQALPKELRLVGDGALLPVRGDQKVSVFTRGVDSLHYEIGRVLPSATAHLITQFGGTFANPRHRSYHFKEENISQRFTKVVDLPEIPEEKSQYSAFNLRPYIKPGSKGLFFLKAQQYDKKKKRPTGLSQQRFFMVTDLGLLTKNSPRTGLYDVFVVSLATGVPVPGVKVSAIGVNGRQVTNVVTGPAGRAQFKGLADFKRDKKVVAIVAEKAGDYSFIPYNKGELRQVVTRFDTGGIANDPSAKVIRGYVFSDRGIYRPGDEFRIGMMFKTSDWQKSLAGLPVRVGVNDPRGRSIYSANIQLSPGAFEEFRYATYPNSITGSYTITAHILKKYKVGEAEKLRIGELLGQTTVRLEEFQPDRMRIKSIFSKSSDAGWVSPKDLEGVVSVMNLFGTPATSRRVTATMSLSPAYFGFLAMKGTVSSIR